MSAEPIAQLEEVTRGYGGDFVLHPTTLTLAAGALVVITGRSGAGKTTLLQLLAALDRPDAGRVRLFGRDITREPESALSEIRRRRLGIVPQQFRFIEHLNIWRNVTTRLVPMGVRAEIRRGRAAEVLGSLELGGMLERRPRALSGGELQRVALARAIIDGPELVIADEPTSNVDADTGAIIIATFCRLRDAGTTIVAATHDPALVAVADRRLMMEAGRLVPSVPDQRR